MSHKKQVFIPGTKPRGPRRPKMGPVNIAGLGLMVEHFRDKVGQRAKSGDLFKLSPEQKRRLKAAIEFYDKLKAWKERGKA